MAFLACNVMAGELTNLQDLFLMQNLFVSPIPTTIALLTNLVELDLTGENCYVLCLCPLTDDVNEACQFTGALPRLPPNVEGGGCTVQQTTLPGASK
jgi:hypothetical protein